MMNASIHELLKRSGWTVSRLAEAAGVSRCHLSEVLANTPGRGGIVRRKVAKFLKPAELAALGWDEKGKLVSREGSEESGEGLVASAGVKTAFDPSRLTRKAA
jgi:transcriptional regulator with XRE-family HTH domain